MNIPDIQCRDQLAGHILLSNSSTFNTTFPSLAYSYVDKRIEVHSSHAMNKIGKYAVLICGTVTQILDKNITMSDYAKAPAKVITQLYEQQGRDFTKALEGFFIIVLHDSLSNECYVFNNRYQATQCYYCLRENVLFFSHSLATLLAILPFTPELDLRSIPSFLQTGFSYTERTQFKDIFKLLPTQSIHVRHGTYTISDHWKTEYIFDRRPFYDVENKLDEYETIFRKSIQHFIEAYKPKELGCFVSGGHDTSMVFIEAQQIFNKPIHTFTASFNDFGFDEAPKSRFITEKFGGIHHTISIGPEVLDLLPLMVNCIEEPVSGGAFPIFACVFEAQKHVDAMLSGDAGDSLWGEYYPVNEWHKYLKQLPHPLRASLKMINKAFRNITDWERLWESDHVFSLFAQKDMYKDFFARLCSYRHYDQHFLRQLLDPSLFADSRPYSCMIDIPFTKDNLFDALVEAKMLYGLYQYMLPPTQKPLESFGVNYFSPYLNHDLITFINSLPEDWLNSGSSFSKLVNDAHRRKFHKLAMLRYLPKRYVYSAQQSLDVPFHSFLTKRPFVLEKLLKRLKRRGLFNNKTLDRIFYEFPHQKVKPHEIIELKHHGYRIFCLLTLEIWCMKFLDDDRKENMLSQTTVPLEDYLS
jgi:asparagine synthase (glutamine-hydrolysing)